MNKTFQLHSNLNISTPLRQIPKTSSLLYTNYYSNESNNYYFGKLEQIIKLFFSNNTFIFTSTSDVKPFK